MQCVPTFLTNCKQVSDSLKDHYPGQVVLIKFTVHHTHTHQKKTTFNIFPCKSYQWSQKQLSISSLVNLINKESNYKGTLDSKCKMLYKHNITRLRVNHTECQWKWQLWSFDAWADAWEWRGSGQCSSVTIDQHWTLLLPLPLMLPKVTECVHSLTRLHKFGCRITGYPIAGQASNSKKLLISSGLSLALIHWSTNMLKWMWASGIWKALVHTNVQISKDLFLDCRLYN